MTATNHALTGAIVALAIKQPAIALPLAFLSHYILDAIPHFGIHEDDVVKRNAHWLFRTVVSVDTVLAVVLIIAVPLLADAHVSGWLILCGMLAGIAPDSVWIYHHVHFMYKKIEKPFGKISQIHQRIQWFEKPWGLPVEVVWVVAALFVINGLAA